jgi:hypothetical protein
VPAALTAAGAALPTTKASALATTALHASLTALFAPCLHLSHFVRV